MDNLVDTENNNIKKGNFMELSDDSFTVLAQDSYLRNKKLSEPKSIIQLAGTMSEELKIFNFDIPVNNCLAKLIEFETKDRGTKYTDVNVDAGENVSTPERADIKCKYK